MVRGGERWRWRWRWRWSVGLPVLLAGCIDGAWVDLGQDGASGGNIGTGTGAGATTADTSDSGDDEPAALECARSSRWRTERRELPASAPAVDVIRDGGAVADGEADDTDAIRAAIALSQGAWEHVYFPPGTYRVTDTIEFRRQTRLVGAGAGHSRLVLDDGAAGFDDPSAPRPVLQVFEGNNTTHHAYLGRLAVDVGADNPGAVGIAFTSHNGGGIDELELRAAPGSGAVGLDLSQSDPGPAYFGDLLIEGFDRAVDVRWGIHGSTFEFVQTRGQREATFFNRCHPLQIRCANGDAAAPFLTHDECSDFGMSVVRESTLRGDAPDTPAIVAMAQTLVVRDVTAEGYAAALTLADGSRSGLEIDDYSSARRVGDDGLEADPPALLDVPARPELTWPDPAGWTSVDDFTGETTPEDWTDAIQSALDSGAPTLFFPNFTHASYPAAGPLVVRPHVRHIFGMSASLGVDAELVIEDRPADAPLFIEHLRVGTLRQSSGATLVMRQVHASLVTDPGSGPVFVAGLSGGSIVVDGGEVYAASSEVDGAVVDGGIGWFMGIRAVGGASAVEVRNGGTVEIWGGLLSPLSEATEPAVRHQDAALVVHANIFGSYPAFAETIQDGEVVTIDPPFSSANKPLYVARP